MLSRRAFGVPRTPSNHESSMDEQPVGLFAQRSPRQLNLREPTIKRDESGEFRHRLTSRALEKTYHCPENLGRTGSLVRPILHSILYRDLVSDQGQYVGALLFMGKPMGFDHDDRLASRRRRIMVWCRSWPTMM